MASPTISNTAVTDMESAVEPYTVTLPSGSGGLLLACVTFDDADTISVASGSAQWSEISQTQLGGSVSQAIYARDSTGSDDLLLETSGTQKGEAVLYRISGAEALATQAPEVSTPTTGTNNDSPDAGSVSPTGGSKDYLFIWVVSYDPTGREVSALPTNYANLLAGTTSGGGTAGVSTGDYAATTDTEDPGAATLTSDAAWICTVAAVHPATGPVSPEGSKTGGLAMLGHGS